MMGLGVLDWTAGPFLTLYVLLYIACLVASMAIARATLADGRPGTLADPEEAAVLGRGRERLGEVIASRLLERGALKVEKGKLVPQPGARGESATESAILALPAPIAWSPFRKVTDAAAGEIEKRLVRRGLLQEDGEAMRAALFACLPLFGLLLLGLAKAVVGSSRGHPIGFLVFFMVATAGTILVRWLGASRQTRAGKDALLNAVERADRLKLAPAHGEAAMAVALFGTGVLATSALGDFHRMRATSGGSDSGGSGDSGGDGGSGCGRRLRRLR
ncbi:TIGR04222 domain-containing membrane protein [Altererythrobacter buctensis]|uniref:TIGR04222 domain-containing membrane protein n=2 Tax=Alteraurantiacibacter buctensis TaxID=1503981 RepID=A0A844Z0U4_9SPHN|nr:TIGR04222 domain-containing membrane protein [Alteraurantiacibacter buctensis]